MDLFDLAVYPGGERQEVGIPAGSSASEGFNQALRRPGKTEVCRTIADIPQRFHGESSKTHIPVCCQGHCSQDRRFTPVGRASLPEFSSCSPAGICLRQSQRHLAVPIGNPGRFPAATDKRMPDWRRKVELVFQRGALGTVSRGGVRGPTSDSSAFRSTRRAHVDMSRCSAAAARSRASRCSGVRRI